MATPLWSRSNRVGAKSLGVTVKRVSPKVFAPGESGSDGQSAFVSAAKFGREFRAEVFLRRRHLTDSNPLNILNH
jgi:hypothetical protein